MTIRHGLLTVGGKRPYLLSCDGTNSKVHTAPNLFAQPTVGWSAGTQFSGIYSTIREGNAAGAVLVYSPAGGGGSASFDVYASSGANPTTVSASATLDVPGNNSGIFVHAGDTINIIASGTWNNDPIHSWGPDGDGGSPAPSGFVLPGAASYSLVGRIGTSGAFFEIGLGGSWTASQSGYLYLIMNDRIGTFGDNSGSLSVSVASFVLVGNDTGITVNAGDSIVITASGTWSNSGSSSWGPGGNGTSAPASFALPGQSQYSLIGRVGTSGAFFEVGTSYSGTASATGKLYLLMNDDQFADNTGKVTATITTPSTGGNAAVRYSSDYGATFGAALTIGASPGTFGGFDVQHNGTVSIASCALKTRKATTLGGAYSDDQTWTQNPGLVVIPWSKRNSLALDNTGSSPEYIVGLLAPDGSSHTLFWIVGGVPVNITPVIGGNPGIPAGPDCLTTYLGKYIAYLGLFGGVTHLVTSKDGGATWIDRGAVDGKYIRVKRLDNPAGQKLYVCGGGVFDYTSTFGVNLAAKSKPGTLSFFESYS